MRRLLLALTLAACKPTPSSPTANPPPSTSAPTPTPIAAEVEYTLGPIREQGLLTALAVEVRWHAPPSGISRLELPERWADARELWRHIEGFTVEGGEVKADGPTTRIITTSPGAPLIARYRVRSAYANDPSTADGQPFAPIVRPTWFHAFGESLFAVPDEDLDAPARFTWTAPDLPIATDLEHFNNDRPGLVGDVLESIVIGGEKLQVHTLPAEHLRIAMLGEYSFTHAAFIALALEVVSSQRAFWGDHGEPFLITVAPQTKIVGSLSLGGTGRSDAFVLTMSEDAPLADLRHLLAHEYFHTWNPRRLGHEQDGVPEGGDKWFSEGFTEFYTWRLLLRAGLFTLEDYVAAWNATLREYDISPVRGEPNRRIVADYWNDRDVGHLPYRRGPLLAAIWDQRLRVATHNARDLDDVLLTMRDQLRDQLPDKPGDQLEAGLRFLATYKQLGGPDLAADHEKFVVQGTPIELPTDTFGPCITIESQTRPVFERGWDPEATSKAGNVISGLRKGTPAYRAGLRDGMAIVEVIAGQRGDSTIAYVLRVRDGKRERTLKFTPAGTTKIPVRRLVLSSMTPQQRESCTRPLAGL